MVLVLFSFVDSDHESIYTVKKQREKNKQKKKTHTKLVLSVILMDKWFGGEFRYKNATDFLILPLAKNVLSFHPTTLRLSI